MALQGSPISEVRVITGSLFKGLGFLSLPWKGHPFLRSEHRTTRRASFLHVANQGSNPSTPNATPWSPPSHPEAKAERISFVLGDCFFSFLLQSVFRVVPT